MHRATDPLRAPEIERALRRLRGSSEDLARVTTRIAGVPAPLRGEGPRAELVAGLMREAGLVDVERDGAGNVLGHPGPPALARGGRSLLVTAHLDCVYPPGTEVEISRAAGVLSGRGVGDNSAGVAAMLAAAGEFARLRGFRPARPVLFAATVGEEGEGGLRGIRHVFEERGASMEEAVCVDGLLGMIVTRGIAVRRHRITVRGPGGHSWADWGAPSANAGLARVAAALARLRPRKRPRTTLNIGVMRGGSAVNSVAAEAWLDLDLRSESPEALSSLEERALALVGRAGEGLSVETQLIDERPWGECPDSAPIVRDARRALEGSGLGVTELAGSTEASVPMSLGVPPIAFGVSKTRGAHSAAERVDVESLGPGAAALFALVVLRASDAEPEGSGTGGQTVGEKDL